MTVPEKRGDKVEQKSLSLLRAFKAATSAAKIDKLIAKAKKGRHNNASGTSHAPVHLPTYHKPNAILSKISETRCKMLEGATTARLIPVYFTHAEAAPRARSLQHIATESRD